MKSRSATISSTIITFWLCPHTCNDSENGMNGDLSPQIARSLTGGNTETRPWWSSFDSSVCEHRLPLDKIREWQRIFPKIPETDHLMEEGKYIFTLLCSKAVVRKDREDEFTPETQNKLKWAWSKSEETLKSACTEVPLHLTANLNNNVRS